MNNGFIPYGPYAEILNIVGRFKILDLKSLMEFSTFSFKERNLQHKVSILEENGFLKSLNLGRNKKHIYLSNKGIKLTNFDHTYEISNESLFHDVLVGTVSRELSKSEVFYDVKLFHEVDDTEINPDAVVTGSKGSIEYRMALEIELTQKSSTRVKSKFDKYSNSRLYDYCLYVTHKEGLFNSYKRFISEMKSNIASRIILMHCDDLSPLRFNYKDKPCFFKGEMKTFEEVFLR